MAKPPLAVIVQPDAAPELAAFGNRLSVFLAGEQTGGTLALMLEWSPPGGGPPFHVHEREDEIFIVLEGQISYCVGGQWSEVRPGGVIFLPKGTPHTYRNDGPTPARHWIITTPAGFERFFAECAAEFARTGRPEAERIAEIHQHHGISLLEAPSSR